MKNSNKNLSEITRSDFPLFSSESKEDKRIIYLDHAATSQKPKQVIDAISNYYSFVFLRY